jgi:hypothetical protein
VVKEPSPGLGNDAISEAEFDINQSRWLVVNLENDISSSEADKIFEILLIAQ